MFSFLLLSLLLISSALANENFTQPPSDLLQSPGDYASNTVLLVGSAFNITWDSKTTNNMTLWLLQDGGRKDCSFNEDSMCQKIASTPNNHSYPWTISKMGMEESRIYYICAFYTEQPTKLHGANHFCSQTINITEPVSISSTASSTMTARVVSTSIPSSAASTTAQTSKDSGPSSELPLAVGLGVGLPLGLAVAIGSVWLFLHYRKRDVIPSAPLEYAAGDVKYKYEIASESEYVGPGSVTHEIGSAEGAKVDGTHELDGSGVQELGDHR